VLGVSSHAPEECGTQAVHPWKPDEVEAWNLGDHAALMSGVSVVLKYINVDPSPLLKMADSDWFTP